MGLSDYNHAHEKLLAADLNESELRLGVAFVRCLLGWRRQAGIPNEGRLGRVRLRQVAAGNFDADPAGAIMDNRTFDRALAELRRIGIVDVLEAGKAGKGNRTRYRIRTDAQKVALQRPKESIEKVAQERPKAAKSNGRSGGTQKVAVARLRKGDRKVKTPAAPETSTINRRCFDAYIGGGGSLQLDRERGALARNVAGLVKAGFDDTTIVAACRESGRRREFPGYLKQRAEAIAADGGACEWDGLDRSRLTVEQLGACTCKRCEQWATAKAATA